jgi:hypothetical protein
MHAKLFVNLGEDVELRLAHSAARQPRANGGGHRCTSLLARKTCQIARGHRRNLGTHSWLSKIFGIYAIEP